MVSSTVVPSARSARTADHTSLRPRGSSPVVGSSRNSTAGRWIRPAAMSNLRRIPARVLPCRLARRVGQPELLEERVGPRARIR